MIRAREAEADEMMRAGHDLVVKVGIQEAFEARQAIRAAAGRKRGVHKAAPIVVHDGQVAQNFTRGQDKGGAKLIGAKFQPQILCFAAANRTFRFTRNCIETTACLVFVNAALEQIRQRARDFRFAEVSDEFRFGNRGGFLKTAGGDAVFDMGTGSGKRRESTIENVAALMREMQPAMSGRGNGADGFNFVLFALEADDAEGRAHARNFGDEQFAHGAMPADLRRGFAGFWRGEMRCRISTESPCSRLKVARRSATRRR